MSTPARAADGEKRKDPPQQQGTKGRGTRRDKILLGLAVVAALAGLVSWAAMTRDGGSPSCVSQLALERRALMGTDAERPAPVRGADDREVPLAVDQRAEVREGGAGVRLAFGDDRTPMVRRQAFLMPRGVDLEDVAVTVPFGDAAQADERPLPAGHVRAEVVGRGPGQLVSVAVCVNPQLPDELAGGTYTAGALVGAGERFAPMTVEVTVQDDRGWLVALAALVGVAAGLFIKLYSDVATPDLPDELHHNFWSTRQLVTVGAGLATGVYSFLTIYADDPTFVARFSDLWRVTAETFAGTLAAKTLTDLAKRPPRPTSRHSAKKDPVAKDPTSTEKAADGTGSGERAQTEKGRSAGPGDAEPAPVGSPEGPPTPAHAARRPNGAAAGAGAVRELRTRPWRKLARDVAATAIALPRLVRDLRQSSTRAG